MNPLRFLTVLALSFGTVWAEDAQQTDWSGDSGQWGPVLDWDDSYYSQETCLPQKTLRLSGEMDLYALLPPIGSPADLECADLSSDGFMDIVCADYDADRIVWWKNYGTGSSWIPGVLAEDTDGVWSICCADLDGDGDTDVAACMFWADELAWWENADGSGGLWTRHTIVDSLNGPQFVHAGDIDGDGDQDLLYGALGIGNCNWLENTDGAGTAWDLHVIIEPSVVIEDVCPVDIDGDGDLDVASCETNSGSFLWSENLDGTGTSWVTHTVSQMYYPVSTVGAADLDGDGDIDLFGTSTGTYGTGSGDWWENLDSQGGAWNHYEVFSTDWPTSMSAADLDLDGDLDLLASFTPNCYWDLVLYENTDGAGSFSQMHIGEDYTGFTDACSADTDGDGTLEVVAGCGEEGCVIHQDMGLLGTLDSSVLDCQEVAEWGILTWEDDSPDCCSVGFRVRSSQSPDSSAMGEWSALLSQPCSLDSVLAVGDRYFQYRAVLESSCFDSTPVLQSVSVSWTAAGSVEGEEGRVSTGGCLVRPNPAGAVPTLCLSLPLGGEVDIRVYDTSGRMAARISTEELQPGPAQVMLPELRTGMYLLRAESESWCGETRFAVLR